MSSIYVPGRNSVKEILRNKPESILKVFISVKNPDSKAKELINNIKKSNIKIIDISKDEIEKISEGSNHQGFVAELRERKYYSAKEYLSKDKQKDLIVILDSIFDPHNFGAILRASECFGAGAVAWSSNKGVGVTSVVAKTSVGASEIVPLIQVKNIANFIEKLKKKDYWVVAADAGSESKDLNEFEFPQKTALILGSEGSGVQDILLKNSDFTIKIPMQGSIDSLNVSQAAAVFLAKWSSS